MFIQQWRYEWYEGHSNPYINKVVVCSAAPWLHHLMATIVDGHLLSKGWPQPVNQRHLGVPSRRYLRADICLEFRDFLAKLTHSVASIYLHVNVGANVPSKLGWKYYYSVDAQVEDTSCVLCSSPWATFPPFSAWEPLTSLSWGDTGCTNRRRQECCYNTKQQTILPLGFAWWPDDDSMMGLRVFSLTGPLILRFYLEVITCLFLSWSWVPDFCFLWS